MGAGQPGMPKIDNLNFPGTLIVDAHRSDQDPAATGLYEELPVTYEGGEGIAAHGALHSPVVRRFLGY